MGGAAPIALSEILAYCRYFRINDDDDRDRLLRVIHELDGVYLEEVNRKKD